MLRPVMVYKMLPDGSEWAHWQGFHLPISDTCPTVWTPAGSAMYWYYNTWQAKHNEITYFWPSCWYVIHAFYDTERRFAGCYCDVVMPNPLLQADATEARYVDLYVDVVVQADHSIVTKDEEVLRRAAGRNPQLALLHDRTMAELGDLAGHARAWTGPFACIADEIVRTDWQDLDPDSAAFSAARDSQWEMGL
jgi:hypothetical protein